MKKMILRVLLALLLLVLLAAAGFGVLYAGRLRTVNSIEKITDYSDYNLYRMDVRYDYSIDDVINYGITDNQSMIDAILKETLPLLPIHMKAPQFGCSAFATVQDRHIVMGATTTSSVIPRPCWSIVRRRTVTNPWRWPRWTISRPTSRM